MKNYRKAIAGALLGGASALVTAFFAGGEWKQLVLAFVAGALGVGGGVAVAPANKPKASLGAAPEHTG